MFFAWRHSWVRMTDSAKQFARAFAPASIGNLAAGFDQLGLAIEGPGDHVNAHRSDKLGVRIRSITGSDLAHGAERLPLDAALNTASIAVAELLHDLEPGFGVELEIEKDTPLGSGMGGSAASAVAAVVAANALMPEPLAHAQLLPYALEGEAAASKAIHADNVAPSLFGGLVWCPANRLPEVLELNMPDGLSSILVHPELVVATAESRQGLSAQVSLQLSVRQQSYLAGVIAACYRNDSALLAQCLRDEIIEPQRSAAITGFSEVQNAAFEAGALACSISGSGPSVFAISETQNAEKVRDVMIEAFAAHQLRSVAYISATQASGARVLEAV